ncbi:high chlorophyll fluorescence phenotype protein [Tanacetum coccineum]|uniref:High chlorophyll fluorescence phenotype protein n=1 Tax=Tanacetum coccineum TaxID=301880 RepID=A0ABQ5GB31_9ASTR
MLMLPTSVKLVIGDVGDPAALRSVVEGCNKIIYCATARSSITVDLNRVDHQGVYNLSKGFQDYNNKLAQLRAGKNSKSKLLLAKFKSAESLNGCEVRKGTYFQDEATAKYDGGMDTKFEFSESGDAVFSGYVFTRGYVDLSTKLSLPLGSTLDRYEGLILSIGGNGRSYVLILESGPTVRVPLSSFRPVNLTDLPLDPFLIHTFTIRFEPRRHRLTDWVVGNNQDLRSFQMILEYIKALPTIKEKAFCLAATAIFGCFSSLEEPMMSATESVGFLKRIASSSSSVPKPQTTSFVSRTNFSNNNNNNGNKRFDNKRVNNSRNNIVNTSGYNKSFSKPGVKSNFNADAKLNHNNTQNVASLSFTNEHMMKLMSLINDVPSGNIHFNMIDLGANQHMTVSTKNIFRIVDISDLNLTVGYPNETFAKIKYVGNLQLFETNIMYDVLVVLEYYVSLLSVHKLIRDSRMFVGFDEHKCYIQDLNQNIIMGNGSKSGGLYLFDMPAIQDKGTYMSNRITCFVSKSLWHSRLVHPSDQVVTVLQDELQMSKKSHVSSFDICHKAKQSREPFPLSDHKTL